MLSFEQIKELMELVATHRLRGIEVERSGFRLCIHGHDERGVRQEAVAPEVPIVTPAVVVPPAAPSPEVAAAPEATEEPTIPDEAHLLRSPIVGTFYAAPAPDAEPFVRIGDRVRKGQVLCIVEAMKLMNEIECDVDGEVLQVFPKNAQPVEFGESLFAIKTT